MSQDDLLSAVMIGLLFPALLTRPPLLGRDRWPGSRRGRLRAEYLYTVAAVAAATFGYLALLDLLPPRARLGEAEVRAVSSAGVLVLSLGLFVHFGALRVRDTNLLVFMVFSLIAALSGSLLGSLFKLNALSPIPFAETTLGYAASNFVLITFIAAVAVFYARWAEPSTGSAREQQGGSSVEAGSIAPSSSRQPSAGLACSALVLLSALLAAQEALSARRDG